MKYCGTCGEQVVLKIPLGDSLPRFVCLICETIHYENPKIVVGCIPEWNNQILLCRRAIEPRYGLWTFPAGFMENNETLEEAMIRETFEEAKANVSVSGLYAIFSITSVNQVYLVFRGSMQDSTFGAGEESLEVKLFNHEDIPWSNLAFPVIHETLERYCKDWENNSFSIHVGTT